MVGGLTINLTNIILSADVKATNETGAFGNSYRVSSAGNKELTLTVSSGATVKMNVTVSNSQRGYAAKAELTDGNKDVSGLISKTTEGLILSMPKNTTGLDQTYRITVTTVENENIAVVVTLTVKSEEIPESVEPTVPTDATPIPTLPLP